MDSCFGCSRQDDRGCSGLLQLAYSVGRAGQCAVACHFYDGSDVYTVFSVDWTLDRAHGTSTKDQLYRLLLFTYHTTFIYHQISATSVCICYLDYVLWTATAHGSTARQERPQVQVVGQDSPSGSQLHSLGELDGDSGVDVLDVGGLHVCVYEEYEVRLGTGNEADVRRGVLTGRPDIEGHVSRVEGRA